MKRAEREIYERLTGGLSRPSKMPGWSYSLPAGAHCNVGKQLLHVKGSVCNDCYAQKGHYVFPAVTMAQLRRLEKVKFEPRWVEAMTALIGSKREKYFRWHDSGDLMSFTHLDKIVQVAKNLPDYQFWLPTLEHVLVRNYLSLAGSFPPNLAVRLSTAMIDTAPISTPLCTSSVVSDNSFTCPASKQGNVCGDCRMCWDQGVKHVSYRQH